MSEKRLDYDLLWNNYYQIIEKDDDDKDYFRRLSPTEIIKRIAEQQATITEYEDFCYNLCMFILGKDLDEEYREEFGKEYKIITKWKGCGGDE